MAKQNFISGGYYGKLGDTVGQRWKNKRTIRTYVIPRNPRTEVQQANRARFANLVPFAQLGMSANKGVSAFIKENVTEWQARMSACSYFYSLGYKELDLIPLYPQEYTVPYIISTAKRTHKAKDAYQYLEVVGTLPTNIRNVSVLAKYVKGAGKPSEVYLFEGVFEQQADYNLKVLLPSELELTEDTKIRIVSRDDVNSATDMIASAMINVSKPDIIYLDFDTTVTSITHVGATYSITTNQSFLEGTAIAQGITIKSVIRGEWQTNELTGATIVNDNGYAKITGVLSNYDENNVPAMPVGSQVYFGDVSMSNDYYVISASGMTENYSNDDLTRSASVTYTVDGTTQNAFRLTFSFGGSNEMTMLTSGYQCALNSLRLGIRNVFENINATVGGLNSATREITTTERAIDWYCPFMSSINVPAFTIKVLGITYNINAVNNLEVTNGAEYGLVQGTMFESDTVTASTLEPETVNGLAYMKIETPSTIVYSPRQLIGNTPYTTIDCSAETGENETVVDFSLFFDTDASGDVKVWANFEGTNRELVNGLVEPIHVSAIDFVNNFLEISWYGKKSLYKCTQMDELWIQSY